MHELCPSCTSNGTNTDQLLICGCSHNASHAELDELFSRINGAFFPGGGASIAAGSPVYETAKYIIDLAIAVRLYMTSSKKAVKEGGQRGGIQLVGYIK